MNKTDKFLQQLGKNAQNINLTPAEKNLHRQKLQQFMADYSAQKESHQSPFASLVSSFRQLLRRPAFLAAPLAVIFGTGVVLASQSALPGSVLYPIKTNVVEKIQSTLATTHEQKAELNKDLAIRRLDEAESLVSKNQLTPEISKQLTTHFEEKGKEMEKELEELQKNQKDQVVQQVRQEYSDSLKKHQEVLRSLQKNQSIEENDAHKSFRNSRPRTGEQAENLQPVETRNETALSTQEHTVQTSDLSRENSSTSENNIRD
jgi:hypothetical protein